MYSGAIKGTGARYCPSIEDKIVRFADKDRHQIFIEPMGDGTKEMYLQGLSTSMPIEIQRKIINSIRGLENAKIMRPAYAIEYDCCDPLQLRRSLEFKNIENLFGAGQFNGTSGYEEAAAQGLIAGINAALKSQGKPEFTLDRSSSYIGMLIDDLITKGTNEPYRVMTSRTEYRLSLRQDNADERLMKYGLEYGLVSPERYAKLQRKLELIEKETDRVKNKTVYPTEELNKILRENNASEISAACKLIDLLKRPELNYDNLKDIDTDRPADIPENIFRLAMIRIRYGGYIKREEMEIARHKKLEGRKIPKELDYSSLKGLRIEAVQKLEKMRPENIGEASRISGISPADVTALLINLDR
jgi:tRNA uridine 5-carboxymethylaminomethyl modification enzyme